MDFERTLTKRLQRFYIVDLGLIKITYLIIGLFIFAVYPVLDLLDAWFYAILALLCALPLGMHFFSYPGNIWQKTHHYIKTNTPANHVLLALTMFFYALLLGKWLPMLVYAPMWVYLVLMLFLGCKPLLTFCLSK